MPKWDSTEAPVCVTVDDPDDFTGHMDDKPLKLSVTGRDENAGYGGPREAPDIQVAMSPAEAYHLVDDLNAAADACWGAAEYVVTAHTPNRGQRYVGTMKAPTQADAVRRTVDLLETREAEDELSGQDYQRLVAAREADRFTVYRADSGTLVTPDELNSDSDTDDN